MNQFRIHLMTIIAIISLASINAMAQSEVDTSRRNAIVKAVEKAAPAVVTINVVDIQRERVISPLFHDFRGLFGFPMPRPRVRGRAVEAIGSGFIFDDNGHILTNYHILQEADAITSVTLSDGRDLEVEFVGADERTDIAVLKASGKNLPHIEPGDSDDLMIGEWSIAVGNPFGNMMRDPQPSVSVGVISAVNRRVSRAVGGGDRLYQKMIQTDAAINPGNSGGPLVNAHGEAIGVNTMIFSKSGGHQGLGFAIPMARALKVADEIIEYGHRRNPWFGFHGEAVDRLTDYARRKYGIEAEHGVLVTEIHRESPAYRAGLRLGDVILRVNGESVEHPTDIDFINWDLFIGDTATMEIDRQGVPKSIEFEVEEVVRGN